MLLDRGMAELFSFRKINETEIEKCAKMELLEFVCYANRELYNEMFIVKPFHVDLCNLLTRCARREVSAPLVIINMPPRFSKTRIASLYCMWCFLKNPKARFIWISYSHRLSTMISREVRDGYKFLKKSSRTALAHENSENWKTPEDGLFWISTIPGGAVTGVGAGSLLAEAYSGDLIIDDASSPANAFYETHRQNVQEAFINTLFSRRNNWDKVNIIHFAQRLNVHDLSGWLISESKLPHEHFVVQALNENGESTFPERVSTDVLLALKDSSPYTFASQQQQQPVAYSGSFFLVDRIKLISSLEYKKNEWRVLYSVRGWDISGIRKDNKANDKLDWTQGVLLTIDADGVVYIVDCRSYRGTIDGSVDLIVQTATNFDTVKTTQVIEEEPGSSGKFLTQYLQDHPQLNGNQLYITKPHTNKRLRCAPVADFINSHKMCIVDDSNESYKWVANFLAELASFPEASHDDRCDSLASAFNFMHTVKKYIG